MNSHPAPVMSWTFLNASTLNSSKPISSRGNASVRYLQTRYHFIKKRAGSFFCKVVIRGVPAGSSHSLKLDLTWADGAEPASTPSLKSPNSSSLVSCTDMLFTNPNTENLNIFKLSVYGEVVPATRQANHVSTTEARSFLTNDSTAYTPLICSQQLS
ncbi:unnamed protein product [Fusarium graminearum]|uniref:Chromosome 1, complete genome n=2 Tax=Gibberella zeae TaxID=5518 RepID=I1RAE6_GIBZE|nr:hypothetical protein FGSG_00473 [Fusarium graminearum PH-1]CAF3552705.1 unnamed protein product [Fusarium graminearum]ESU05660.1 hypothetical protein FGSG_00473 [Fusarium graminearum PH-1]CAF3578544.1 unnamed protein product [Fusarium graminearum]CAG1985367.1 unnamed protein product [Fusarium graminearum]CAG1997626.1 unnamed protein product [Fusarium graminearum]|eukprot:XP_011316145.1 hypothetical protein FGSG_00473 [Fusarium graminearum PH-1]